MPKFGFRDVTSPTKRYLTPKAIEPTKNQTPNKRNKSYIVDAILLSGNTIYDLSFILV
jgi:hypothetical protein